MVKHEISRRCWPQLRALIKQDLVGVTESDLISCHGQRSKLVEKLREIYGISSSEAEGAVMYYEQQLAMCYSQERGRAGRISHWDSHQQHSLHELGHS